MCIGNTNPLRSNRWLLRRSQPQRQVESFHLSVMYAIQLKDKALTLSPLGEKFLKAVETAENVREILEFLQQELKKKKPGLTAKMVETEMDIMEMMQEIAIQFHMELVQEEEKEKSKVVKVN